MKKIFISIAFLIAVSYSFANGKIVMNIGSFKGSAYDIGFNEGKYVLKLNPYFNYLLKADIFPETTEENYKEVCRLLKEFDPSILDEMKGFAEAINAPLEDVVVKLSGYGFKNPPIPHACSQIAVLYPSTADHHTYTGRNYDFSSDKKFSDFCLFALYPDTTRHSIGTTQFVFGRIEGINENGLYAGMSFAHGNGRSDNGFFFPIIIRILLDMCSNADEALEYIKKIPHTCSYNYLIADKDKAYAVEVSPPKISVRYTDKDNTLIVLNHYMSDEMKDEQKYIMSNSLKRYDVIKSKISKSTGLLKLDDIKKVLSGHSDEGVCQHYYNDFLGTIWSAVFDLNDLKVYYAIGAPCINKYNAIDFKNEKIINKSLTGTLPESVPFQ